MLVRIAELDSATLVFWSAISACLGLGLASAIRLGGRVVDEILKAGAGGIYYVVASTVTTVTCVVSLRYTSVANVMTIYATLPFVASAIAYLWLRECVSRRLILAGLFALTGVTITAGAATTQGDAIGMMFALLMTASFAWQLAIVKRYPQIDILLFSAISAGASALAAMPFMEASAVSIPQLAASALYGLIPYGLGTALAVAGSRRIKSGEAGFVSMLDVVLNPFWVWMFFSEQPTPYALIGCGMVLVAVAWYLFSEEQSFTEAAVKCG